MSGSSTETDNNTIINNIERKQHMIKKETDNIVRLKLELSNAQRIRDFDRFYHIKKSIGMAHARIQKYKNSLSRLQNNASSSSASSNNNTKLENSAEEAEETEETEEDSDEEDVDTEDESDAKKRQLTTLPIHTLLMESVPVPVHVPVPASVPASVSVPVPAYVPASVPASVPVPASIPERPVSIRAASKQYKYSNYFKIRKNVYKTVDKYCSLIQKWLQKHGDVWTDLIDYIKTLNPIFNSITRDDLRSHCIMTNKAQK